jgi:hypothetical protein
VGGRLRPAIPRSDWGNVLRRPLGAILHTYRQTSGRGRIGIYLWRRAGAVTMEFGEATTAPQQPCRAEVGKLPTMTPDQATQGEGAVARLAWVIVVALIALALWLGVG